MLILSSTGDLVEVVTSATADIEVHASWADNLSGAITPGRTNTASITTATTTTVVDSPAASTQRNVRHLNIRNNHASTTCTVTVQHTDATSVETLMKVDLLASEALVFDEKGVWTHYLADGSEYSKAGWPIATQAEQETATSLERGVTPANQQGHPSAAKFHMDCLGTGIANATALKAAYNITSVTDTGAGRATFNINTDFSSANWACIATAARTSTSLTVTNLKYLNIRSATQAAGSVQIECYDGTAGTAVQEDPGSYQIVGFGDQ